MVRRAFAPQLLVIFVWIAIIGAGSALTSAGGLLGYLGGGRDARSDVSGRASQPAGPPAAPAVITRPPPVSEPPVAESPATPVATPSPSPPADVSACAASEPLPIVGEETAETRGGIVDSFVLESPDGPITILLTDQTVVRGDLSRATEVQVKGLLQEDGSILATTVKVRCPQR